ncbi:SKA2 protein, partial [Alcedo cyanopectus]|nr:SKA2 protein [Ceyx cyanopectus]
FQKGLADLDYIQHRLEFEIRKSLPENPSAEENPVAVLEELEAVKARYKKLWLQLEKISKEERESIKGICAALEGTMKTVKVLQQLANLK